MNKILTKEVLERNKISTIEYTRVFSILLSEDIEESVKKIVSTLKLPLIVKPAHLGSSIGINIAHTQVELKKFLLEASQIDSEILVEKFVQNFIEYNVSVRSVNGTVEASEVEKPISRDEILSFADKYQRGGKKTGGMASLSRELPAKISKTLTIRLQRIATSVFEAIRAKGMIRVDFMVIGKQVYVTEVNPIPGSMSYYLWEASGISFKEQISDLILQAIYDHQVQQSKRFEYQSDIVEKFVSNIDR
jgi:D-alanine-D-alanine ligase